MVVLELILKILDRFWGIFFSRLTCLRLGNCGVGLTIKFPAALVNPAAIRLGDNVTIREHAWLNCEPNLDHSINLSIGNNCYLGRFIHINARESVTIEDNVLIADRVFITDHHHGCDSLDMPIIFQPLPPGRSVRIGQGSWIGIGAAIFPGVTIGRNAIVAANAVVTRDVPDRAVARGVPARMFERSSGAEIKSIRPLPNL